MVTRLERAAASPNAPLIWRYWGSHTLSPTFSPRSPADWWRSCLRTSQPPKAQNPRRRSARLVAVDGPGARRRVDDEPAVHAHLEVQRGVDVAVVEVRPRVHGADLVRVLAADLEAHVAHAVVVRAGLHPVVVQGVDVLRGLDRVVEHLAGADAPQRGGEQVVPVVRLERPELDLLAVQLDLVADELRLELDVGPHLVRRVDAADLRSPRRRGPASAGRGRTRPRSRGWR